MFFDEEEMFHAEELSFEVRKLMRPQREHTKNIVETDVCDRIKRLSSLCQQTKNCKWKIE